MDTAKPKNFLVPHFSFSFSSFSFFLNSDIGKAWGGKMKCGIGGFWEQRARRATRDSAGGPELGEWPEDLRTDPGELPKVKVF